MLCTPMPYNYQAEKPAIASRPWPIIDGSGSEYDPRQAGQWQIFFQGRRPIRIDVGQHEDPSGQGTILAVKRSDVRTAQQHLANIRQVLNPAITDLSIVFGVSRQAIYKWISGNSTPEPDKLARIVELSGVADAFHDAGVSRAAAILKMKAFDGRSLLDLIAVGEGHPQHVQALIAEAKAMEAAYVRAGLARSKTKPTSDWQSSISIPGFLE